MADPVQYQRLETRRVIYLDQNHVSHMAKGLLRRPVDAAVLDLFWYLRRMVEAGQLFYPFSFWHIAETTGYLSDEEARMATAQVLDILSQGRCFRSWIDVRREEQWSPRKDAPVLGFRAACFPQDWPPETGGLTAGMCIVGGVGFVELSVRILSGPEGRQILNKFKDETSSDFRDFIEKYREHAPLSNERAWLLALGHYTEMLRRRRPSRITPRLEDLVGDGFRTLATISRFGAETLRNLTRKVKASDPVDVCHVAHLAHAGWFLTDGNVCERSRGWSGALDCRVFANARALHDALRSEFSEAT